MLYIDMSLMIPLLATGYLITIYVLLTLAQRVQRSPRYFTNPIKNALATRFPAESESKVNQVKGWSQRSQRESPPA